MATRKKGRNIKRLVLLLLLAASLAAAAVLIGGGDPVRWLGKKGQVAGEAVKDRSDKLGDKADTLKEKAVDAADDLKKDVGKKITGD